MWRAGRGVGAALLALAALLFVMGSSAQSADAGQSDEDEVISMVAMLCPERKHIYVTSIRGQLALSRPDLAQCTVDSWRLVRLTGPEFDPKKPTTLLSSGSDNPGDKIS